MEMISIIKDHFESDLVQQFLLNYEKIRSKYSQEYSLVYFGINLDEQGLYSVKFYFHILPVLTKNDVELFLPDSEDYFRYIKHYDGTNNQQGCAFEIKFKRGEVLPTFGFHYQLTNDSESQQLVGHPKFIEQIDLQNNLGVNYEYTGSKTLIKRYFYYTKAMHLEYFANRYNIPLLAKANFIEFAESNNISKINIWFGINNSHLIYETNLFTDTEKQQINEISNKYNVAMKACGVYEDKKMKAIYFFKKFANEGIRNSNVFS